MENPSTLRLSAFTDTLSKEKLRNLSFTAAEKCHYWANKGNNCFLTFP